MIDALTTGLDRARSRQKLVRACAWGLGAAAVWCLLLLVAFRLDMLLAFTTAARSGWLAGLGAAMAAILLAPLVAWRLCRPSDEQLALLAERAHPAFGERLLTSVELAAEGPLPISAPTVRLALAQQAADAAAGFDFGASIANRPVARWAWACAAAILLLVLQAALMPGAFGVFLQRLLHPGADIPVFASTQVWALPGDTVIPRGSDLRIGVLTAGVEPDIATLKYRFEGGEWQSARLSSPATVREPVSQASAAAGPTPVATRRFGFSLPQVRQSVTFLAMANDGRSNPHTVRVEERPMVLQVKMQFTYPAYQRRAPETLQAAAANVAAPLGTHVEIEATANKPIASARAVAEGRPDWNWQARGATLTTDLRVAGDLAYDLHLRDRNGFEARPAPRYSVNALRDQPPSVQMQKPGVDLERAPGGFIDVRATSADDYAVERMGIAYRVAGRRGGIALPSAAGPAGARLGAGRVNLGPLRLKAGDLLAYEATATDGDTVSGPHTGKSATFNVRIVAANEMRSRLDAEILQQQDELKRLTQAQRAVRAALERARRDAKPQAAAQAAASQRSIAAQAASVAARMADTRQKLEENGLAHPAELSARAEAAQALTQLAAAPMRQAADAMQQAAGKPDGKPMDAAQQREQAVRQELERIAGLQAPPASASELAREARRLADEQQRLAEASANLAERKAAGATPETAAQQRDLAQQQGELRAETQALRQRLNAPAAAATPAAEAARQAAREMDEGAVTQSQQRAQSQMQSGSPQQAADEQNRAAEGLRAAADALETGLPQDRNARALASAAAKMESLGDKLVDLANQQRAAQNKVQNAATPEEARKAGALERDIRAAVENVNSQMSAAPAAQEAASKAEQNLTAAAQSLEKGETRPAVTPAKEATRNLLQAAQEAQEAARLMRSESEIRAAQAAVQQLARDQASVREQTRQAEAQKAGSPEKDVRERAQAIRQKESDLQNRAWRMEAQMPSQMAKTVLAQANQRMDEARQGLDRQETGADTQRQQQHAEQTLGRLARSLERAAQASLFQQQTGQSQTPEAQLAAQLGDMEAARELEAQIRQETQGIQSRREAQPNQEMTPKLRRETEMAAQSQAQNQWQTYSIGDRLRDMPDYTQPLRQASRQMEEVRAQLEKRETGQPTQANEEKIVSQLDQLVARARKEMEQQRSKMLGSSKPQNSARKADTPSPKSNAPLVQADSAALGAFRPGGRGFGPLSPKAQQLMRQGRQERVPAEYRELVNQYYKALSERGR